MWPNGSQKNASVPFSELPGTSRLFADFVYHFDRVAEFYSHDLETAAKAIDFPSERRAVLVAALRKRNGESALLDMLAREGTYAVVTGQQVGLLTGPSYTVYKALTAVKLARSLTGRGIPAVPIFWLATEDHDLAEVDHAWVFDASNQPVSLRVAAAETGGPVGKIRLEGVPDLSGLPFAPEAYRNGRTFGEAFQDVLRMVLGEFGMLFLDPLDAGIRGIAAPFLLRAWEARDELRARLIERNRELESRGYHTQVLFEPASSLFFTLAGGKRQRATAPQALSPNALLRPVMQDYLLPTVAHVGGPAEVAYLAQSEILYRSLGVPMPVEFPRACFTLLDGRAAKLMGRYGLSLRDFFEGEQELRERMARRLVPGEIARHIEDTSARVTGLLDSLGTDLLQFDPGLDKAFSRSRSKILYQLSKTGRKTAREAMRRDQRAEQDARYLSGLVYPHKHLQERFYGILPFLARHGADLIDRLYESIRLDCPDHQVLAV